MPPDTSAVTFIVPPIYLDDMDEDTPRLRAAASVRKEASGNKIKTSLSGEYFLTGFVCVKEGFSGYCRRYTGRKA